MDDEHIFPNNSLRDRNHQRVKKIFLILGVIIVLILIAVISYTFGVKNTDQNGFTADVSESPLPTEPDVISPTITTDKLSPTKRISPTKKLTPTPSPPAKTKIIASLDILDGFRSSNGSGNETSEIRIGRNVNLTSRGFVSFNIDEIPSGVKIQEATLRIYQAKIIGSPYNSGGNLKADHLTYGDTLDNSDYASPALSSGFAVVSGSTIIGWKEVTVTDAVRDDISNARSRSQFRIHFNQELTGGDMTGDFVYFESEENNMATGNTPQLVVKYH